MLILEVEGEDPGLASAVQESVQLALGLSPIVLVHPLDTLPITEFKSRRIVDRRESQRLEATTWRER